MENSNKLRWGRASFRGIPAIRIAAPGGVGIAVIWSMVQIFVLNGGDFSAWQAWVAVLVTLVFLAPGFIALVWVLVVDRKTIRGGLDDPENSIESTWTRRAAEISYCVVMIALSVCFVISQSLWSFETRMALGGLLALGVLSFPISYLWAQKR